MEDIFDLTNIKYMFDLIFRLSNLVVLTNDNSHKLDDPADKVTQLHLAVPQHIDGPQADFRLQSVTSWKAANLLFPNGITEAKTEPPYIELKGKLSHAGHRQ